MKCGICGVLDAKVRFDSCIEMTSGCVVCEMFESLHGAPYAVCVELKNFYLCVLFWRSFVCFVCAGVGRGRVALVMCRAGMVAVGWASYGSLCDGNMWGESGRVSCIRSRVRRVSVGAGGGVLGVG